MSDTPPPYLRSGDLLSRDDSRLLIVDMQERLLTAIPDGPRVVGNCVKLVQGGRVLGVPVFATEQYPRGLGPTVAPLAELVGACPEKLRFSCAEVLGWDRSAESSDAALRDRPRVVVAGIETHVCVLQTALDLLAAGYLVYVAADAVASRRESDWRWALDRLSTHGAIVTTTEAVLFEWCEVAGSDEFREISRLVRDQ